MGKAYVITSGKGGTGKTSVSAGLACCLADRGYRTLCIDMDIGLKNLDIVLGLSDYGIYDFYDVLCGACSAEDAVIRHPQLDKLFFLTAPAAFPPEGISEEDMTALIKHLKSNYDFCIIDSPAGLGDGFYLSICAADSAVVVATGDSTSCRDAGRAVMELYDRNISDISLIVNRVRPKLFRRSNSNVDDIIDSVGARLLGLIPEDKTVILAANQGVLLKYAGSKGAYPALDRIASRIIGERTPLHNIKPNL